MSSKLSQAANAYIQSVNQGRPEAYCECFAADAVVDDGGRKFHGIDEIAAWSKADIFAVNVTFEVLDTAEYDEQIVITTKVDGDFDRAGLPDPVVIRHYLKVCDDKITSLSCRLVMLEPVA